MKRLWIVGLSGLVMLGGSVAATCAGGAGAEDQGWVSLFDGKTTEGWEVVPLPNQPPTKWEVKDGLLCGSGGASMLVSTKGPYKNFKFRAELKINDKGNSGMYFRTARRPGFTDGYEVQVNATHGDPIKTGSLYTMVHLFRAPHQPDEFFTQEVECKNVDFRGRNVTAIKVSVNGEVLYETLDYNNTFREGYIAFQQHDPGSRVCIRKVEVMPLP
ncbi:MAG: hypothetical protein KatS3mg108_1158 [Isosphaeraceae bacterium]|jgi:hypothetical protein|nr:MAG: hypothetical protein KatS3mg108_1158 [Isosphaeraceae bacterium]